MWKLSKTLKSSELKKLRSNLQFTREQTPSNAMTPDRLACPDTTPGLEPIRRAIEASVPTRDIWGPNSFTAEELKRAAKDDLYFRYV